jgi:hypothetical protein
MAEKTNKRASGNELDEENTEDSMFRGAFKALKYIGQAKDIAGGMKSIFQSVLNTITSENGIPLPGYFITAAVTAFLIFITFSIIYIVFRIAKGA